MEADTEKVMGVIGIFYSWVSKEMNKDILSMLDHGAIDIYKKYIEKEDKKELKDFLEGFYEELKKEYGEAVKTKVNYYLIVIPSLFDIFSEEKELMEEIDRKNLSDPGVVANLLLKDEDIDFESDGYIAEIFGFKRMVENLIAQADT